MAGYRQPCAHCGAFIDRDARFCPQCATAHPFTLACPSCLHEINRSQLACPACGRPLHVACPACGQQTFVLDSCERCGASLTVRCGNRRCGQLQFFENEKCTACGKKLKRRRG